MLRKIQVYKGIDFRFGVICEFWPAVTVEYADCIRVDGFELDVGQGVLTGVVGLVL